MEICYSIIIPFRDKYPLFIKAIESIPDREDIQIIIVDNAKEYLAEQEIPKKHNSTITYATSSSTKGAGAARNVGLSFVKGKYILFCDADDYYTELAFNIFDEYVYEDFDIVFFKSTSINLNTGSISDRHLSYNTKIDSYLTTGDEDPLRYGYEAPWGKLYKASFILSNDNCKFEEIPVNNDAWFSLMAGHNAKKITASSSCVYVITEGVNGSSLTKCVSYDNILIRFRCAIKTNKFLKSIGHYRMHIRLAGYINLARKRFGYRKALVFTFIALKERMSIF